MKKYSLISGMAIFYLSVIPFLIYSNEIYAQEKNCGTMEVHERLMRTVPIYRANQESIQNRTREYIRRRVLRTEVVKIPVVVHVVHNTPEQDISEGQINSQIRILNEDYKKLNADVASVPSAFQPLVADTRIEFVLACIAPDGSSTNGILRKGTSVTEFTNDDAVKFSTSGGSDAWPRDKYLNIWVCNLTYLGYAQFPGGPAETDGVVIAYDAFGDAGTVAPPFNKGRTLTHEIRHWLNLRHIRGVDCPQANAGNPACCGGDDNCDCSDFVDDTPNQACTKFRCVKICVVPPFRKYSAEYRAEYRGSPIEIIVKSKNNVPTR